MQEHYWENIHADIPIRFMIIGMYTREVVKFQMSIEILIPTIVLDCVVNHVADFFKILQ